MKKLFTLMTGIAALSCSAFGAQVSFSHTTASTATPFTDAFTLSSFDPTLGTLTAIAIDFTATTSATLSVFNTTGSAQSFTNGFASVPLVLTAPTGTSTVTASAGPTAGSVTAAFAATSFTGLVGTTVAPTFNVAPANFTSYELPSASTVALTVSGTAGTFSGTANPGVYFGGNANAGGVTKITYTYTVAPPPPSGTPEPATMGLLGSALVGIGFLKFRTRKA